AAQLVAREPDLRVVNRGPVELRRCTDAPKPADLDGLRAEAIVERDDAADTPAISYAVAGEAVRPRRRGGPDGRRRNADAVRAAELHRGVPEAILQPDRLAGRGAAALVVADQRRRLGRGEGSAGAGRVAEAERSHERRVVRSPAVHQGDL